MNEQGFLEALTYAALFTKTATCKDNKGPADIPYIVSAVWGNKTTKHKLAGTRNDVEEAMISISASEQELGKPVYLGVTADSYITILDEEEPAPRAGGLKEDFFAGDFSVGEAIVVTIIDYETGTTATRTIPYLIDDKGMPEFQKPDTFDIYVRDTGYDAVTRFAVDGKVGEGGG